MKHPLAAILTLLTILPLYGQGGKDSFDFTQVPVAPVITGLGGVNVSLADQDVNLLYANPALNGDTLNGDLSFNYLSYFADVNAVNFAYQHDAGKYGAWHIGINHFGYGTIQGYDDTGEATGEFTAGETVVIIGHSHRLGHFSLGANAKFLDSNIAGYHASALALDIGGVFHHPTRQFTAGLVFKNAGVVLTNYTGGESASLPFDVQAGVSFKPEHMPSRFSITVHNAEQPNVVVGMELLLSKNVNLRVGYNHRVHQALKLEETSGGAGFSYGLMFKVKAFAFAYSRGGYHVVGGSHNIGITVNTNLFLKKKVHYDTRRE